MKREVFNIIRYDAEEGKVFDWATPRYNEDENGELIEQHLYAKTLFIGPNDNIYNYIEIIKP
jgi:hypothetical protein